ncbi:unnamed protein product [Vicia faba]|uniref:Steroid 5-alpha reductase C-terminal domain-containing protein n=1 Tax=Vicia faba TaxID=3906 RepID=A0AAV1B0I5_VICFA|nr:unnamed protein product [Vicia faba]
MGCSNMKNAMIAFLAPLPSILFYLSFINNSTFPSLTIISTWHPLVLVNILFFFNVNLLFWLIAQIQSSHWMIDPYWTVIPVMLIHYYSSHPLSNYDTWRSKIVIFLTWVWSIRLFHNYFRREKWQWGSREDWRFTNMSQQYGKQWWWASFLSIYLPHQLLLIGLSLPMYVIHSVNQPLNIWDLVAAVVCISGIVIAYIADTQLYNFVMSRNNDDKGITILEIGLWYYSRHPNYLGEQLWWWGLVVFGWNLGHGWTSIGALSNTMCLGYVTKLVEQRMLKQEKRAEAYRMYQNTTSVWIPCFNFKSASSDSQFKIKDA